MLSGLLYYRFVPSIGQDGAYTMANTVERAANAFLGVFSPNYPWKKRKSAN
jgi:hypothetical protein